MNHCTLFLLAMAFVPLFGQTVDTVEIELGNASRMLLMIGDTSDIDALRDYDYNALMEDVLNQMDHEEQPSDIQFHDEDVEEEIDNPGSAGQPDFKGSDLDHDHKCFHQDCHHPGHYPHSVTYPLVFDFGINNYVHPSPETSNPLYSVRPWGSWYVGLNVVHKVRFSRAFSIDTRIGLSAYNFKFEQNNIRLTNPGHLTTFQYDQRDLEFTKSKLMVAHALVAVIPTISTPRTSHRVRWHSDLSSQFRIGIGPYVGYRINSYNKLQYEEDDEDEREKEVYRNNFNLQNIRYGARLQVGLRDLDFFVQYDASELFREDRGPKLNAYSFGITF